jgi:curved DNA-binding protein CbpA
MCLYRLIGITNKNATNNEIRSACLKMLKTYHPDVCKDIYASSKFREYSNIYKIFMNESKRKSYNRLNKMEIDKHYELWKEKYEHYDPYKLQRFYKNFKSMNTPVFHDDSEFYCFVSVYTMLLSYTTYKLYKQCINMDRRY